jgi:hypothetical protein
MIKQKLSLVAGVQHAVTVKPSAVVVEEKPGTVTAFDKIKYYYKWLISAVSVVLAILVENQDLMTNIFGASSEVNGWVAAAILIVGNIGVVLKENEKWVNKIPSSNQS